MANFNSFLATSPKGAALSDSQKDWIVRNGWAICPKCDKVHAAFLAQSHTKVCNPDFVPSDSAVPWMPPDA